MLNIKPKKVGSLKSMLLYWMIGSAIVFAVLYNALMEYQFRFGIEIRTKADFEWYVYSFEKQYQQDKQAPLPTGPFLKSYIGLDNVPKEILALFEGHRFDHQELEIYVDEDEFELPNDPDDIVCESHTCEIVFFYSYQLKDGNWLYMVQGIEANEAIEEQAELVENILLIVTFIILLAFAFVAFTVVKKITLPVQNLAHWANHLSDENLTQKIDHFEYQELNQVAEQLQQAFERQKVVVDKERIFLQQLSHELRTPLATASGNLDIIKLVTEQQDAERPEAKALSRLHGAVKDMCQLTDSLLWLHREQETTLDAVEFDLADLVTTTIADNRYLLAQKSVEVNVAKQSCLLMANRAICAIVVVNLIRNAFQYTEQGQISVEVKDGKIQVINDISPSFTSKSSHEDYGFGIGLSLVQRIAKRMQWPLEILQTEQGWLAEINFHSS